MTEWRNVPLGELGTVVTGATPRTSVAEYYGGETPFVTPGELGTLSPVVAAVRNLTPLGAEKARIVPPGTVMVCCIGSLGKVGIAGREVATNQQINSVVFNDTVVDPRYGLYACGRLTLRLNRMAPATTIPIISKSKFEEITIPVPPLDVQRRIAQVLDAVEALRAMRSKAVALLDDLAQSIFLDMFGVGLEIYERWPTKNLGGLLSFLTSGSRGWARYYSESSGSLFLRIQNVCRNELDLSDVAYVNPPRTAETNRTRVEPGDVLLSITADLGRTAVVPRGLSEAFINQHLCILRTRQLDPDYLSSFLSSPVGQEKVLGKNRQGVKAGLNFDDVKSLQIPCPPLSLQQEFARRLHAIRRLRSIERSHVTELDSLFTSIQQRAFRGDLWADASAV
ncbi:restriction endonuclease subunit S [Streptomyces sp. NPDC002454]